MAVLPIVIFPDYRLKARAKPVETVDHRCRALMDDMLETMYAAPGIGLAAPQVGVLERIIVVDSAEQDEAPNLLRMANPEIVARSDELSPYEEGCLSLPGYRESIERPAQVTIRYLDQFGQSRQHDCDGLLAVVVQHEIDHLNGKLLIDHISSLKRDVIARRLTKEKQRGRMEAANGSF